MGIILGALAGAGGQLADYADKSIAQDQALERERYSSDLATQRAMALEDAKVAIANRERTAMVQRVGDAAGSIADQQMAPKVAQEQAGIVDPSSWTPEQQAAVDQSNALDRSGIVKKAMSDGSAAEMTGDISPKDAAAFGLKSDAMLYKTLYENAREQGRNDRADARIAAMSDNADKRNEVLMHNADARLQAMLAHFSKQGSDNPTKSALSFLDESRKALNEESSSTKALMAARLSSATNKKAVDDITAEYQPKLQQIEQRRRQLDSDFNKLRSKVGLDPVGSTAPAPGADMGPPDSAAPAAAPAASAPSGIPPGWSVRVK